MKSVFSVNKTYQYQSYFIFRVLLNLIILLTITDWRIHTLQHWRLRRPKRTSYYYRRKFTGLCRQLY